MVNEMKKVLLCTINDNKNLAQVFSTYALYNIMQEKGHNPVVYDKVCQPDMGISPYIRTHCCIFSDMYAYSRADEYLDTFDILISGSEKRWKCGKKEGIDSCFLNFGKKSAKRIAYAPSFGRKCELPLGPRNAVFFLLKKFDRVFAADYNTRAILNMDFGIDAETVCNPILMLDQYPHSDIKAIEGIFIFAFFENRNNQKQKVAEMAEATLRYRVIDFSKDIDSTVNPSEDAYIDAIEKSSLIITDSSVITHLAIVYQKPFITVLSRTEKDSAECLSTLESIDLIERVIYTEDDVLEKKYLCRKPIRYGLVEYKLHELRHESIQYLERELTI